MCSPPSDDTGELLQRTYSARNGDMRPVRKQQVNRRAGAEE
jgi:hypothetical protein